jgi:biotin carboxylase
MNVLFLSPGFPMEMPSFVRGLAAVGAQVIGIGDQPQQALPEMARESLAAYHQVPRLWDEDTAIAEARQIHDEVGLDRIECLWEPGMILAAQLREALGVSGMNVSETMPFRDKELMKQALDRAGIRTPRHIKAESTEAIREAVEAIGLPLIIKPIAGAGSADTYQVDDGQTLEDVLPRIEHLPEVSVEEFIDGEEFTFDTVCANGELLFENVTWYRPRVLIARTLEWVSPQTVCLRDIEREELSSGRQMGRAVLEALGFRTGFTHMEWFLKADGEAVFGEIGARPPGGRSVDVMNFSREIDLFTGWAEAVCHGRLTQPQQRRYNAAIVFKRAQGEGRIQRIEGLDRIMAAYGPHIVSVELLPPGAPRRNWRQTLLSDGFVFLRHPDLQMTLEIADRIGTDIQLFAG